MWITRAAWLSRAFLAWPTRRVAFNPHGLTAEQIADKAFALFQIGQYIAGRRLQQAGAESAARRWW